MFNVYLHSLKRARASVYYYLFVRSLRLFLLISITGVFRFFKRLFAFTSLQMFDISLCQLKSLPEQFNGAESYYRCQFQISKYRTLNPITELKAEVWRLVTKTACVVSRTNVTGTSPFTRHRTSPNIKSILLAFHTSGRDTR